MKHISRRILALVLAIALLGSGIGAVSRYVAADAATISATKEKISELEKKKSDLQKKIKSLESEKNDIINYISKLDAQLTELETDLAKTEDNISDTTRHLNLTKSELAQAQHDEREQYANMKSRIKFMYENGGSDYLEVLLGATDFSDLLNRTEYIGKISEYDKTMLERYIALKHLIEQKKGEVEDTLQELEDYRAELEVEKEQVEDLRDKKEREVRSYESKIADSQSDVASYSKQIAAQEELLEELIEAEKKRQEEEARKKKEAEEAAKRAAASKSSGSSSGSSGSSGGSSSSSGGTSASNLRWPLGVSGTITSPFGSRSAPTAGASTFHRGIDIGVSYGTAILAAGSGTVTTAGYNSAMGNYVVINHGGGLYTYYEHCSRFAVSAGDSVSRGQTIAYVGSTGISTNPHLHFGVYLNGGYVNPLNYVSR
ncbi:MAG: peptidoglycan DD-metalloendopeptidase family protein [Lachnospiraceae bacterium]|nr:peptidoglycan DD-metalloendopeptidase family protein [Lachnospiraceae bacterium]